MSFNNKSRLRHESERVSSSSINHGYLCCIHVQISYTRVSAGQIRKCCHHQAIIGLCQYFKLCSHHGYKDPVSFIDAELILAGSADRRRWYGGAGYFWVVREVTSANSAHRRMSIVRSQSMLAAVYPMKKSTVKYQFIWGQVQVERGNAV